MKRLPKFFLAVLLLTMASASWAACPEGYKSNYKGECLPADVTVRKPGTLYGSVKALRGQLRSDMNFAPRNCNLSLGGDAAFGQVIYETTFTIAGGRLYDTDGWKPQIYFSKLTDMCLLQDNGCQKIIDDVQKWVSTDGLRHPDEHSLREMALEFNGILIAMMNAYATARQVIEVDKEAEREILQWFKRKVTENWEGYEQEGCTIACNPKSNNHNTLSGNTFMTYGVLAGDDRYFREGFKRYVEVLEMMENDGSFRWERERGTHVLHYTAKHLNLMMSIAEKAHVQGYDLYSLSLGKNRNFHHAFSFFLDALEDNDNIIPYAKKNHAVGKDQDYKYLRSESLQYLLPPLLRGYRVRFPNHPNLKRAMELTLDARLCEKEEKSLDSCRTTKDYRLTSLITATPEDFDYQSWGINTNCIYYTDKIELQQSLGKKITTSKEMAVRISKVERDGTSSDGMVWREIDVTLPNHGSVFFEPHVWFWDGATEDKPNHVGLQFNHKTLPSIDIPKMKRCGGYKWFAKETSMGNKRVMFPFRERRNVASCLFNALDKNDQAIVKAVIDQIEEIIDQGTEGQPDADYWKKIAKIIKDNGSNVIQ